MSKKELPKNKKRYIVTLDKKFDKIVYKYNPNAVKNLKDEKGKIYSTIKNDGTGYAFNIKLHNNQIIVLDTKVQEFIINKLVLSGKIKDYDLYLTDLENTKLLEDMENDCNESKTSNSKQADK